MQVQIKTRAEGPRLGAKLDFCYALKKFRGCIAASPSVRSSILEEVTSSFSWLSLPPFYSPLLLKLEFFRQEDWRSAYSLPCIEIEWCLVKKKVNR